MRLQQFQLAMRSPILMARLQGRQRVDDDKQIFWLTRQVRCDFAREKEGSLFARVLLSDAE